MAQGGYSRFGFQVCFEMLCSLASTGKVFGNISGIYHYMVPIYP